MRDTQTPRGNSSTAPPESNAVPAFGDTSIPRAVACFGMVFCGGEQNTDSVTPMRDPRFSSGSHHASGPGSAHGRRSARLRADLRWALTSLFASLSLTEGSERIAELLGGVGTE
jgi:hypothetical protein